MKRFASLVMFVVAIGLIAGCGPKKPSNLPKLYPAVATVTANGAPLADAVLNLSSDASSEWFVSGNTDEQGKATLMTNAKYPGAPEGSYKVAVIKMKEDPNWKPKDEYDTNEIMISALAPQYESYMTSGLECTITSDKNSNVFNFEVQLAE